MELWSTDILELHLFAASGSGRAVIRPVGKTIKKNLFRFPKHTVKD
jgi:hypothetical protein